MRLLYLACVYLTEIMELIQMELMLRREKYSCPRSHLAALTLLLLYLLTTDGLIEHSQIQTGVMTQANGTWEIMNGKPEQILQLITKTTRQLL